MDEPVGFRPNPFITTPVSTISLRGCGICPKDSLGRARIIRLVATDWVTAIGTVLAAAAAVYFGALAPLLRAPKLRLSSELSAVPIPTHSHDGDVGAYWAWVVVTNVERPWWRCQGRLNKHPFSPVENAPPSGSRRLETDPLGVGARRAAMEASP